MSRQNFFRLMILVCVFAAFSMGVIQGNAQASSMQSTWNNMMQAAHQYAATNPLFQIYFNRYLAEQAAAPKFPYIINPTGPIGFNPIVNYTLPNYGQSPNLRKFVDSLPGLGLANCVKGTGVAPNVTGGTCNQNNLGEYIPVAVPVAYPGDGAAYYEIGGGETTVQMHSDLAMKTSIRGYYETQITPGFPAFASVTNEKHYLGPAIVAREYDPTKPMGSFAVDPFGRGGNGWPVRMKFANQLPVGSKIGLPVSTDLMGGGMGPYTAAGASCDMGAAPPGGNCAMFTENRLTTPHLHGGRTPWISDGTTMQWLIPAADTTVPVGMRKGSSLVNVPDMVNNSVISGAAVPCIGGAYCYTPNPSDGLTTSYFTNQQSGRLMFWHDHVFGITRLNVYKGVAAPYLLISQVEDDLIDGTNISGVWGATTPKKVLPGNTYTGAMLAYRYGIPLVIQDKAFVNDTSTNQNRAAVAAMVMPDGVTHYSPTDHTYEANCVNMVAGVPSGPYLTATDSTTCGVDPLWKAWEPAATGGSLYMPHTYMPVEDIYGGGTGTQGNTTNGRWDYAPFLIPPGAPLNLTLPEPTIVPEHFADTMVVNGTAFPYVTLPNDVVRFRILVVGNDRIMNLQLYRAATETNTVVATQAACTTAGGVWTVGVGCDMYNVCTAAYTANNPATMATCTEVKMIPDDQAFALNNHWPASIAGVGGQPYNAPDPTTAGPDWYLIGNEGGFLANVADLPAQPIDYEYNHLNLPYAGVTAHSLMLLPAQRADVVVDFSTAAPGDVYMLYNDAPAPFPAWWPINDFFTNDPDNRPLGGGPTTPPGYGPNTRTIMQIRIAAAAPASGIGGASLLPNLRAAIPLAFAKDNDAPIVKQPTLYNAGGGYIKGNGEWGIGDAAHWAAPIEGEYCHDCFIPGVDTFVNSPDITLNLTNTGQSIARILTLGAGNSYTKAPNVMINPGNGVVTTPAVAYAELNPTGAIALVSGGTGCTSAPTVTIGAPNAALCTAATAPSGTCGIQATAVATAQGGFVTALAISEPGAGYTGQVTISMTGGGCTTAPSAITYAPTTNTMGSIYMANHGAGYTSEPRVYITNKPGVAGLGGTAVALLNGIGSGVLPGTPGAGPFGIYGIMTSKNITEGNDPEFGRLDIRMGSTPNPLTPSVGAGLVMGLARYTDPPTEYLNDGEITLWRITHLGVDSHALHFHLFDVQVVQRVDFTNVVKSPEAIELGWRDTIRTNPAEDIIVAFTPHSVPLPFPVPISMRLLDPTTPAGSTTNFYPVAPPVGVAAVTQNSNVMTNFGWEYVYHCHMLEHEENDFMRPMVFIVPPAGAPFALTASVTPGAPGFANVKLNWVNGTGNINSVLVYRANSLAAFNNPNLVAGAVLRPPTTTFTDGGASQNTTYYYAVKDVSPGGTSGYSNIVTVSTIVPPQSLTMTQGGVGTVIFNWNNPGTTLSSNIQCLDFGVNTITGPTNHAVPGGVFGAQSFTLTGQTSGDTLTCRIRSSISVNGTPTNTAYVPQSAVQVIVP